MENDIVIKVSHLFKTFHIRESKANTIRERILHFSIKQSGKRQIRALQDINFKVHRGEIFGIIGRNGSGKSTLLKIILGAYKGDSGSQIEVKGKVIRLALGMGFDPNLSARENIYVNGSIIGLTFRKIGNRFDDIVGFAELEDFIDTPLKFYSSGMRSRLAFSIAIHAEADIFLIDEFFGGVGDEGFKERSEEVFKKTFLDQRTILMVSHQMNTISEHCQRVLALDNGRQIALGKPEKVIDEYRKLFKKNELSSSVSNL